MRLQLLNQLKFASRQTEIFSQNFMKTGARNAQYLKTMISLVTLSVTASIFSGIRTVRARLLLGASTMITVSRTLPINLRVPGTIGPSLRPNFMRNFRAIFNQLSLFWK